MIEEYSWNEIYKIWKMEEFYDGFKLSHKPLAKYTFVKYDNSREYIYGYDWLSNDDCSRREDIIKHNPVEFLYFTKSSNKGTIKTAEMLLASQNEEERAAIIIAATTFELLQLCHNKIAYAVNLVALKYLKDKFWPWHHAMRRLIPDIMIPSNVLRKINVEELDTLISLIRMNTYMLYSGYTILLYSSLQEGEIPENIKYRI